MADSEAPALAKKRAVRKRKIRKAKPTSYIAYGQPDRKVVVRLLPPTLCAEDFMAQALPKSPTLNKPNITSYYRQGTRTVKPFEDPVYSSFYAELATKEDAESLKTELDSVSFYEAATGDNIQCQVTKAIFQEMPVLPSMKKTSDPKASASESVASDVFRAFCEHRKNRTVDAFLKALESPEASKKKKKKKDKKKAQQEGTASEKGPPKPKKKPADPKKQPKNGENTSEEPKKEDQKKEQKKKKPKKLKAEVPDCKPASESTEQKPKKKPRRKPKKE